jgi:hypothetical protein
LGRFDPETTPAELPPPLGTATQDLRATVEEKLLEIVEAAEARAHEIEDQALAQALEIEEDSEEKARARFRGSTERVTKMVAAIDGFEREIAKALGELRQRAAALATELGGETTDPVPAEEPEAMPEEAVGSSPSAPEAIEPDEAREHVRKQILDLFMAGKPRGEAERMLGELEDGGSYTDLLDEVYQSRAETQQGSRRRRGGRRRRRPGSPA